MGLSPVGMSDPARSVERGEAVLSSMGWFALSIGPEAPDNGLAWYDALYFAAFSTPGFELSREPLPAAYWQSPVGLTLCIGRRIERRPETLVPGIVEHPLVFTVHTTPDAPEEANAPAARPAHTETG